jgi:uncharacterized protein YlxW (UPF0749 family)
MGGRLAQLSLFVVALVIGVLLVGQLRSQARPLELSTLSAQELSELVTTLRGRNVELADALSQRNELIRTYEVASVDGRPTVDERQAEIDRIEAFGGLRAVVGQGIVIRMEGAFDPTAINDVIFELRGAGAEAIAVDDVRITARSVAVLGSAAIEIDGVELGRVVEIQAIGSPSGLETAMRRPGGQLTLLEQSLGVQFQVTQDQRLTLPATDRDLAPQAATPVE